MGSAGPRLCFSIPASPTDAFCSQVGMFRMALDSLGGMYESAHIVVTLGDENWRALPERWPRLFGSKVELRWAEQAAYRLQGYAATTEARWNNDYDQFDIVVFCDADTMLVRQIDDLVTAWLQAPAVMGVIAHYPFPMDQTERNDELWLELGRSIVGRTINLGYRYSLLPDASAEQPMACPFHLNYGFVVMSPQFIRTMRETYLSIRPRIAARIKAPYFAGQIALTLSITAHDIPARELGMRYNFPNDPIAEELHPNELQDVRLVHYLRTDRFDRHLIFATAQGFYDFLGLALEGSNKIFQDRVRQLTGGRYPF